MTRAQGTAQTVPCPQRLREPLQSCFGWAGGIHAECDRDGRLSRLTARLLAGGCGRGEAAELCDLLDRLAVELRHGVDHVTPPRSWEDMACTVGDVAAALRRGLPDL